MNESGGRKGTPLREFDYHTQFLEDSLEAGKHPQTLAGCHGNLTSCKVNNSLSSEFVLVSVTFHLLR